MDFTELRLAARELERELGARVNLPYLPGKTAFRDALYKKRGISEADAERLCDSLEQTKMIRFERSITEGPSWTIHPDGT